MNQTNAIEPEPITHPINQAELFPNRNTDDKSHPPGANGSRNPKMLDGLKAPSAIGKNFV